MEQITLSQLGHPNSHTHVRRSERLRIIGLSMAILTVAVVAVSVSWILQLYDSTIERSRQNLEAIVLSQVSLIEAVTEFDTEHSQMDHPDGAAGATLPQVLKAYARQRDFGETGELVVGTLDDQGNITFLQQQRHQERIAPIQLDNDNHVAEPMRLALLGHSGSIISHDYREEEVLAVYSPIPALSVGLVAKMDIAEIQAPFYLTMRKAGLLALVIMAIGGGIIFLSINPLIRRVEQREADANQDAHKLWVEQTYSNLLTQWLKMIIQVTNEAMTTAEVFQQGLEEICRITKWSVGHVYLRSEQDAGLLEPTSWWYREDVAQSEMFAQATMKMQFQKGVGLPGRVLASGRTVWIHDVTKDSNFPRASSIGSAGIRGGLGVPILVNHQVYAVMEMYSPEPLAEVDEKLIAILNDIGFLLGRIIERKHAESELYRLHTHHQLILHSVGEGIVGLDVSGTITFVNQSAASQLGCTREECLGKPFLQTFQYAKANGEPYTIEESRLLKAYREGMVQECHDEIFWQKDGSWIPVEYICNPVRDQEGRIQGAVLLFKNISERIQIEREKKALRDQLLRATHEAGKSEIATGILHNVGNVLNSTNIAATALSEKIGQLEVDSLLGLMTLFSDHATNLEEFLTNDPAGQQIPDFLKELAGQFAQDQSILQKEIQHLLKNLDHIRSIISAQQKYAKGQTLVDSVDISELIQDALDMAITSYGRIEIQVERSFGNQIMIEADRHKLLEIVVNLFHNARHALLDNDGKQPCLKISIEHVDQHMIQIDVSDNGIGINQEHLPRIFEYGFTTKPDGNGYGLHTAVLAAQELGGTLEVKSDGLGQGATFSLIIPKMQVGAPC